MYFIIAKFYVDSESDLRIEILTTLFSAKLQHGISLKDPNAKFNENQF